MEIKSIRLKDFRQFYGDQTVHLSTDPIRNVTLIHAENGVGKTTILNSVLWAFFGETTGRFEQKDRILNFEALREGKASASVEVLFAHEGADYLATRTQVGGSTGSPRTTFAVMKVGANGAISDTLPNPDAFINTVIPSAMAPYFFFDGEQAETFSSEKNHKAIANAIRDILGSTLIDTAIEDLRYVAKKFNEEIGDTPGDAELSRVEKRISELEAKNEAEAERIRTLQTSLEARAEQLAAISAQLAAAKEASQFQREREDKEHQLRGVRDQLREARVDVLRWIGSKSLASVSQKLTATSLDFIDDESLRGRIPSPYNEEFVKGLLSAGKCVCERPLLHGTAEWRAISALMSKAATAEVLNRVVRARARIEVLKEQRRDAPDQLKSAEERVARLLAQQNELERVIEELGRKIADLPVAEIRQREQARRDLEAQIEAEKTQITRAQRDIELAQEEIDRLSKLVSELSLKNEAARRLVTRRDLALRGAEFLVAYLKTHEEVARRDIEAVVNDVLERTTRKFYRFEVDPSFQIRLLFADGTPTPKSGGENQMMSLAFLAALVQYAQKRSKKEDSGLFVPATVAPLILDSPFGQLDNAYREATAKFVPSMAPQVVLLVSSSQGKDEVYNALRDRIGREYVLIAHNAGDKGDKREDVLTIAGKAIPTTLFGRPRTMTEVRSVEL